LSNPGRGKVSAFNAGVAAASGQYVCLFAGDDIMPEDSLAARYSTIERAGSVRPVVGLSKLRVMSADPKLDGLVIPRAPRRGSLSGTSPLMNREAAKLIFPVPAELPNEDTWMELCISYLDRLEVIHSDILCVYWRLHEGNSNNRLQRHDEFSRRRAARKRALNLFVETYSGALRADQRRELGRLIELERQRVRGSVMGVVLSGAPVMEVIRSLSCTRPSLFWIRQRFFRALSGW
jgi:glycosyltransferase involved in cell wall biosynthesis